MKTFDVVMVWIKQIILNVNVTFNYVVDFFFSPLYTAVDTIQSVVHQWATKPAEEEKQEQKHIGFNR